MSKVCYPVSLEKFKSIPNLIGGCAGTRFGCDINGNPRGPSVITTAIPINICNTEYGCDISGNPNYPSKIQGELAINYVNEAYKISDDALSINPCLGLNSNSTDYTKCINEYITNNTNRIVSYIDVNIPSYLINQNYFKIILKKQLISKMPKIFNVNSEYIKSLVTIPIVEEEKKIIIEVKEFNYLVPSIIVICIIIFIVISYFVFINVKSEDDTDIIY
jgi:hypothetical protein